MLGLACTSSLATAAFQQAVGKLFVFSENLMEAAQPMFLEKIWVWAARKSSANFDLAPSYLGEVAGIPPRV